MTWSFLRLLIAISISWFSCSSFISVASILSFNYSYSHSSIHKTSFLTSVSSWNKRCSSIPSSISNRLREQVCILMWKLCSKVYRSDEKGREVFSKIGWSEMLALAWMKKLMNRYNTLQWPWRCHDCKFGGNVEFRDGGFYNKAYGTAEWSEGSGPMWNRSILYSRMIEI